MTGQIINVNAWTAWFEVLRQVSLVVVPVVVALAVVYVLAGIVLRWR